MLPGNGKRVPGPHYDLEAFKEELRAGNYHVHRSRALDLIAREKDCTPCQARHFAWRAVLSLEPDDYAHSIGFPNGQVHDVYGKLMEEEGWYLKIAIDISDGQPGIVSCHPADYDLKTRKGIVPGMRGRKRK